MRPMTEGESLVMAVLSRHRGRANAIARSELVAAVRMADRYVREVIKALIEEHGVPIGSASHQPCGYWLIKNQQEMLQARGEVLARVGSLAKRARAYGASQQVAALLGQLELSGGAEHEKQESAAGD